MTGIGNASWLELLWTLLAVSGCLVAGVNVQELWRDRADVIRSGWNGYRRRLVRVHLRTELFRLGTLTGFTLVGVAACLTPPNPHQDRVPTAIISGVIFSAVNASLIVKATLDRRDRRIIRRLMDAEDRAWHDHGSVRDGSEGDGAWRQ